MQGSIISKKAAEQLDVLVLDVKFGIGAFMKEKSEATRLAKQMVGMLLTLLLKILQKWDSSEIHAPKQNINFNIQE